jgi:ComF family protein
MTDLWLEESTTSPERRRHWVAFRRWMLSNFHYAADLILPPVCIQCHTPLASHGVLCPACWQRIDFIRPPLCNRLGHPLPYASVEPAISTTALCNPPAYGRARAVARFDGVMRELIHGFKYSDRHETVGLFVRMLASAGAELLADADVICPVPLHRSRLWRRRYNQAAILAKCLADASGKTLALHTLIRTRRTGSQVNLSGEERRKNVASAFAIAPGARGKVAGKHVLMIDDVITTGSTLEACTHVLKSAGAIEVDCLALALVTDPDPFHE